MGSDASCARRMCECAHAVQKANTCPRWSTPTPRRPPAANTLLLLTTAYLLVLSNTVNASKPTVTKMPNLTKSFRRAIGKDKTKGIGNDGAYVSSDTRSSRDSRPSTDFSEGWPSLDQVDSIPPRTAHVYNASKPTGEVKRVERQPHARASWFDGIVNTRIGGVSWRITKLQLWR